MSDQPARGDRRRTALLESLDHHLREGQPRVDQHRRHLAPRRRDPLGVLLLLREQGQRGRGPHERDVRRVVRGRRPAPRRRDAGREHRGDGARAVLRPGTSTSTCSARPSTPARPAPTVRELWDSDRESFVPVVAGMIETERAAGAAPGRRRRHAPGRVLLELNDRMLERLALGGTARPRAAGRGGRHGLAAHDLRRGPLMSRQSKHDQVTFTPEASSSTAGTSPVPATTFDGPHGRPVVVMAHGLGGTKDSGLEPFATGLAEAGLDVLAFDYRGFGASPAVRRASGSAWPGSSRTTAPRWPRPPGCPASTAAGSCSGASRWPAATCSPPRAARDDVAAVVSLTPLVDGMAAGPAGAEAPRAVERSLRSTVAGFRSRVSSAAGREPVMMPIVGPPRRGRRARPCPATTSPTSRSPAHLAQRDRRLGRPGARRAPAGQGRQAPALPAARADRRLRPQRPAAGVRQGRRSAAAPRSGTTRATTSTSGRARLVRAGARAPGRRSSYAIGISDHGRMPDATVESASVPSTRGLLEHRSRPTPGADPPAFERMSLVGGVASCRRSTRPGCRPGRPGRRSCRRRAVPVPALVPPVAAQELRPTSHGPAAARRAGRCVLLHQARGHQGDLRRRPRGLPRRQGQRDPRPGHGRALAAAPGRQPSTSGPASC